MNKKIFGVIAIVAIVVAVAFNVSLSKQTPNQASQLVLANLEALADEEEEELDLWGFSKTSKWSSNLNYHECTLTVTTGAVAIYFKGVLIPAYTTYTVYGNKKVCEREFSLNSCDTNDQTPCE